MKPIWKLGLGIAAGLLVFFVIANWYVSHRWVPRLETQLEALVASETDGLYRLAYDSLRVSLFTGSAEATTVQLIPDTAARNTVYDIRIGRLQVKGAGLLRLLFSGKVSINTVVIDKPTVRLILGGQSDTANADTANESFFERLQHTLNGTRVKHIVLNEGQLALTARNDATRLLIDQMDVTIGDLRIDSVAWRDTTRLYYAKNMEVDARNVSYTRGDSLYRLRLKALKMSMAQRELLIRDLQYGLTVSKAAFYRQVGLAEDIADVNIESVRLEAIDAAQWTAQGLLAAGALHIDSGAISIYKDKLQPNPPENKIGKSPHQQLMSWEQRIRIDSVRLGALDIRFTEVSDQTGKAGSVTFEQTEAMIRNVTNDTVGLRHNRFLTFDARSKVMGAGDLSVSFRFDLLDSLGGHTYEAELGPMNGNAFNRMLTPHLNVEVEHADIQSMRLEMKADDRRTEGTLQFDYQGLKVNLLEGSGRNAGERKSVVSFFANRFLLNDSNPDANGVYHTGTVYISRPETFSFFKMIWRSIREGTKACIGLGD
ncbi:hypothetical protein ACFOET_20665 [Parapedobacter deserti]|uniref:DUF748 domain-containing protein n=1 Tax=Parapedobacter deserti TaxID=1912957 RepID=A0ABV7JPM3_9SPHI